MSVNEATIRLITEFEGFVPMWYADPAHGWSVPTAMYGHTNATGNEPFYKSEADRKLKFTKEQGIATLQKDLLKYEQAVDKLVKVPLNDNQRGALVSFTYNLGEGNFGKSTLLKKINASDFAGAAGEFQKWNKAAGKVLAGLTRRREAERQLFIAPPKQTTFDGGGNEGIMPPAAPIIVAESEYEPAKGGSIAPWLIGAVVALSGIFYFVTQVRF